MAAQTIGPGIGAAGDLIKAKLVLPSALTPALSPEERECPILSLENFSLFVVATDSVPLAVRRTTIQDAGFAKIQ